MIGGFGPASGLPLIGYASVNSGLTAYIGRTVVASNRRWDLSTRVGILVRKRGSTDGEPTPQWLRLFRGERQFDPRQSLANR